MTEGEGVTAFAPATVGNVICGFDVLGLALDEPGDWVTAHTSPREGVTLSRIIGGPSSIPTEPERNSAGAAARALLERRAPGAGVTLELRKGLPLAAGMGGSAASAVAAVVAVDALLGTSSSSGELLEFALEGERVAAGQGHGDNAAPALLGGIVLVRPQGRRSLASLPVPKGFSAALLRPHLEMGTREAREAVPNSVPVATAVEQMGHVAALVHGLHTEDWELVADALVDRIAEPHRAPAIPAFPETRSAALEAGALGAGISGAGPSIVALSATLEIAREVGEAMARTFKRHAGTDADLFVSRVSDRGARVVSDRADGVDSHPGEVP